MSLQWIVQFTTTTTLSLYTREYMTVVNDIVSSYIGFFTAPNKYY
jgi:hypothetical protein